MTTFANSKVGVPIIYINQQTIVLEKPTESTFEKAKEIASSTTELTPLEQSVLRQIKEETKKGNESKGSHKKPKAPNPLSCKKSAKKTETPKAEIERVEQPTLKRKKKRRLKVAKHASGAVNEKLKILLRDSWLNTNQKTLNFDLKQKN